MISVAAGIIISLILIRIIAPAIKSFETLTDSYGIKTEYILNEKAIISALEKQIPKKPNIHGYREGREINTISYTCPICNKHIGREDFCKHCGQALFWESEVEGE